MKLLFVINNVEDAYWEYTNTGCMPAIKRRSVEIELTEEQMKKINLHFFNRNAATPIHEKIESVSPLLEE